MTTTKIMATGTPWVKGAFFDKTTGMMFVNRADFEIEFPLETLDFSWGEEGSSKIVVPVGQDCVGKISHHSFNPRLMATTLGATTSQIATTYDFIEGESVTLSGGAGTLAQTPVDNKLVHIYNASGNDMVEVAASPELGYSYTLAVKAIAGHASEPGPLYATYYYTKTDITGTKVIPNPYSLPTMFEAYGHLMFKGRASGWSRMIFHAKKVIRTSGVKYGGKEKGQELHGFDFHCENTVVGDIEFIFPETV